jgi:hypothetical protein
LSNKGQCKIIEQLEIDEHYCLIDLENLQEYYQELIDPTKLYKEFIEVKLGHDIDLFLRKLEKFGKRINQNVN